MDITPLIPEGRQIIQSYAQGRFRVSGTSYAGGIIVFPEETISCPLDKAIDAITAQDFPIILSRAADLDVVLMGCGTRMQALPIALRQDFKNHGIVVDFMDTGAACRTYNVLMAEGRCVAAILLPVE